MSKEPMTLERVTVGLRMLFRRMDALEAALDLWCTDEELDSNKGNPKLRFNPKGYKGGDFKGKLASEAPPDFLDAYAKTLKWFSENPKEIEAGLSEQDHDEAVKKQEKSKKFDALDAKRCRSWARRKRLSGWKPPPPPPEPQGLGDLPELGGEAGSGLMGAGGLGGSLLGGGIEEPAGLPDPALSDSIGKALDQDLAGPWDATPATAGVDDDDLDGIPE